MLDGFCDDFNNKNECNFDDGDCCNIDKDNQFCSDCQCLDPLSSYYIGMPVNLQLI